MAESPITAGALGFSGDADQGWTRVARGHAWRFQPLRTLAELEPVESLQRRVMGVSDLDLSPVSALIVVPETGGDVLGAFPADDERLAGAAIGWGGYVDGSPRLVSDLLAVDPAFRNLGLGAELKRLQAAHAASRGFREIVWTVDPLRAANARLNFEKLGAVSRRYEIDRYGPSYGSGLYGGMPTDRLHLTWRLDAPRTVRRLLGQDRLTTEADVAGLPFYQPGTAAPRVLIPLPGDVDRLVREASGAAAAWRLRLRAALTAAFADGYAIVGFVATPDWPDAEAVYLLAQENDPA
jgi:predicted GNAT superfamily acetyltransferase